MSKTIKLTSKRQATFPVEVCEQLGVGPGDEISLSPRVEEGEQIWVMKKRSGPKRDWIGSLGRYGDNVKDHSMESIRESIAKGRRS